MSISEKHILDFIGAETLAVLSYIYNGNRPGSALVEFSQKDDFSLIFDTFRGARKYKAMRENQNVSFMIGCTADQSVQYEGVAEEVTDDRLSMLHETHRAKLEDVEKFIEGQDVAWFLVHPQWVKYTDVSATPWIVKEMNFHGQ